MSDWKIDNEAGVFLTGDKVLVEPPEVEEKTPGGIIIADESRDKRKMNESVGVLRSVSSLAANAPELKGISVGDVVLFARFAGEVFPVDGKRYRLLRVRDIICGITKLPDYSKLFEADNQFKE